MNEDMSDMMQKLNGMLAGKEIPDTIKSMFQNFTNNQNSENISSTSSESTSDTLDSLNNNTYDSNHNDENIQNTNPFGNIDIGTIMKIKTIMDKMNQKKDNPRSNLLLSLKPYLKTSRKQKIDQYIQLFNMTDVLESMNFTGGEKKQ